MISFDDFKDDDVTIIQGGSGISVSLAKRRVFLFRKPSALYPQPWQVIAELPISKIRSVDIIDGYIDRPSVEVTIYRNSSEQIGSAIGGALRDAADKRAIKKATGLMFELDFFDEPEFFVNISDKKKRSQALQGLRLLLGGSPVIGKLQVYDTNVVSSFPTDEMKRVSEEKAAAWEARKKKISPYIIGIGSVIAIGVIGALTLTFYQKNVTNQNNRMSFYISSLLENPDRLSTLRGLQCQALRGGYDRVFSYAGSETTHVYVGRMGGQPHYDELNGQCAGALASVDESEGLIEITAPSRQCTEAPTGRSTRIPFNAETIAMFTELEEPSCAP